MGYNEVEILRAACCIAAMDEEVCERERPILEKLRQRLGVGQASFQAMLDRAHADHNFYEEQFKLAQVDPDKAIKTLLLLAAADHKITLNERVVLQHFAEKLGMTEARFDQIFRAAEKQIERERTTEAGSGSTEQSAS